MWWVITMAKNLWICITFGPSIVAFNIADDDWVFTYIATDDGSYVYSRKFQLREGINAAFVTKRHSDYAMERHLEFAEVVGSSKRGLLPERDTVGILVLNSVKFGKDHFCYQNYSTWCNQDMFIFGIIDQKLTLLWHSQEVQHYYLSSRERINWLLKTVFWAF